MLLGCYQLNNNISFKPKPTKNKEPSSYKSLYIKDILIKEIEKIAKDNNTSFNNVVISMIEKVLNNKSHQ